MKRSRGRGRRQQNPVNRSYDSNGPDVRVRGTPSQVYEKYQALARDAMSSGDRVMAENYQQHGEHYYRIMLGFQPTPDEADKQASAANGDAVVEVGRADEEEAASEPLVLMRDNDTNATAEQPAKASRRRGPLRKKKATEATDAATTDSDAPNGAEETAPVIAETMGEGGDSEAANID